MNRKKALYTLFVVMLATITLSILSLRQDNPFKKQQNSLIINAVSINGKIITSEQMRGRQTIMIFFNTHCELCLKEISLLKMHLKQISTFYQVIFISFEPKASLIAFFLQEKVYLDCENVYVISDNKMSLLDFYDIKSYPSFLIFNKKGILYDHGEYINENRLQRVLKNEDSE